MLVITRYRVPRHEAVEFRDHARAALRVLADQAGWRGGHVGRAADDPTLWVLTSLWHDVGSYRRALSAYEVKLRAVPLLSRAVDEPTAFELLTDDDAGARAVDAEDVGLGSAAAPVVETDLDRPVQTDVGHQGEGRQR
ncbi:antibiotic biosynthesis monooxygenase family protein [Phytoactinopolyspora limicola]|uniref:antibiotic biosynthesis monooxygenase family protein n=1 Tax=Phytoactinopolyspora limicola TaxID=2715536 RepID=UPI0014093347|nr:antibiotic biosynthesis monooxygenase [Phytoactinopolyspora limicola]